MSGGWVIARAVTRVRNSSDLPEPVAPTTRPCGPTPPCADSLRSSSTGTAVRRRRRSAPAAGRRRVGPRQLTAGSSSAIARAATEHRVVGCRVSGRRPGGCAAARTIWRAAARRAPPSSSSRQGETPCRRGTVTASIRSVVWRPTDPLRGRRPTRQREPSTRSVRRPPCRPEPGCPPVPVHSACRPSGTAAAPGLRRGGPGQLHQTTGRRRGGQCVHQNDESAGAAHPGWAGSDPPGHHVCRLLDAAGDQSTGQGTVGGVRGQVVRQPFQPIPRLRLARAAHQHRDLVRAVRPDQLGQQRPADGPHPRGPAHVDTAGAESSRR